MREKDGHIALQCCDACCEYNYLGVRFSTKLSFTAACCDLTSKAKNAVLCIMQILRMLNNNNLELFFKLFDSQVQPISLYGSFDFSVSDVVSYFFCRFIAE